MESASQSPGPAEPAARGPRAAARRLAWPAALASLATWGVILAARGRGGDFAIYVRAAGRFLQAAPLYQAGDGAWVFKYAPPAAAAFIPFTLLPLRLATALWNLALVASLALLRPRLAALFAPVPDEARAPLSGAAMALSLLSVGQSLFLALFYGQVDLPMLLLLALAADGAERGRDAAAGLAWALSVAFKPTAVLFGLYLLVRRPRALAFAAAFAVALWMPVAARYGLDGAAALAASWSDTVARTTAPWMLTANPQGIPTLLLAAAGAAPVGVGAATAAQVAALALALAALWPVRGARAHLFASTCFAVAWTSALAWRANFALALPMVALAWTDRSRARLASAALALLAGAVQQVFSEGLLGEERLQAALLARPFALAFGALWIWTVLRGAQTSRARAA